MIESESDPSVAGELNDVECCYDGSIMSASGRYIQLLGKIGIRIFQV